MEGTCSWLDSIKKWSSGIHPGCFKGSYSSFTYQWKYYLRLYSCWCCDKLYDHCTLACFVKLVSALFWKLKLFYVFFILMMYPPLSVHYLLLNFNSSAIFIMLKFNCIMKQKTRKYLFYFMLECIISFQVQRKHNSCITHYFEHLPPFQMVPNSWYSSWIFA